MWESRFVGICGCGECGGHWNVFKPDGTQITKLSKSDAELIAAAPQLLEALRDMVSDHECLSDATLNFARQAIAKATGLTPNVKLTGRGTES